MSAQTMRDILAQDAALIAQGWTRQFTVLPDRVREFVELYQAAGYQVRVEPWAITAQEDASCEQCALIGLMRTIYTRRTTPPTFSEEVPNGNHH